MGMFLWKGWILSRCRAVWREPADGTYSRSGSGFTIGTHSRFCGHVKVSVHVANFLFFNGDDFLDFFSRSRRAKGKVRVRGWKFLAGGEETPRLFLAEFFFVRCRDGTGISWMNYFSSGVKWNRDFFG
jgi:hypothetical protein